MGSETTIQDYLIEGKIDLIENPTLTLLESTLLKEGYSIDPIKLIVKFLSGIKDLVGLKFLVAKKDQIQHGLVKSSIALMDPIFEEDTDKVETNPVLVPAPKSKKDVDGYLKKIHTWLSSKIQMDFPKLRQLFAKSYAFIVKALVGLGIVGTIASASYGGYMAGDKSIIGAVLGGGIIVLLALMIVYLSIINAVEKSEETDNINFDSAFTNIVNGFKRLFTSLKIEKGEAKFGIISVLLSSLSAWFVSNAVDVEKKLKQVVDFTKVVGGHAWNFIKSKPIWGEFKQAILSRISKDTKVGTGEEAVQGLQQGVKDIGVDPEVLKKTFDELVHKTSWFIKFVVVPFILFMTILYLFSEFVDHFNLDKIMKGEESESQEEFI